MNMTATLTPATKKPATGKKQVQIIARYTINRNGFICYLVRASSGEGTYCTTLNAEGKATGCTCPSFKPCYHMVQLEAKEAARKAAEQAVEPTIQETVVVPSTTTQEAQEVVQPVIDITKLQAKDFITYLRGVIRKHGRNAEVGTQHQFPIECWIQELGFDRYFSFSLFGYIEWENEQGIMEQAATDWYELPLYIEDEHGTIVTGAYAMLQIMLDKLNQTDYLFTQPAQQQPVIAAPTIPNAERGVLNGQRAFSLEKAA